MRTILPIAIALAAVAAAPAQAETGGVGFLPAGFELPSDYREVTDEPHGLRLVRPPASLAAGSDRVIAGVQFRRPSRQLKIRKVRVALLDQNARHLIAHTDVTRTRTTKWRHLYLERMYAPAGQDFTLRYTVFRSDGRRIRRDFDVRIPSA